jgi:hypothetical protein
MEHLQEMIRRNLGARHVYTGFGAEFVREQSRIVPRNVGTAWPPRGVGVPGPEIPLPPYFQSKEGEEEARLKALDQKSLVAGEALYGWTGEWGDIRVRDPVVNGLASKPDINLLRGEHFSFLIHHSTNAVLGLPIGPFSGPGYLDEIRLSTNVGNLGTQDYDVAFRIDIGRTAAMDVFVPVAGSPPTGVSTAEQTVFKYESIRDSSTGATERGVTGWYTVRPLQTTGLWVASNLRFYITLDYFFLRVYLANDGTVQATRLEGVLRLP